MTIQSDPQRLLDLFNVVYIASAFLAVVATFCIVVFGNRIAHLKETELKSYQHEADARIAEASLTAEIARQHAEEAKANAAAANAEAARFKVESLVLEARVKDLDRINQEQIFRIRIGEQNAKPRSLSDGQAEAIKGEMQPFSGKNLTLWILSTDVEPVAFAMELGKAFSSAGIACVPQYLSGVAGRGVILVLHSLDDEPPMAKAVTTVLTKQNISVTPFADPERVHPNGFALAIGAKAPFFPDDRLGATSQR